MFTNYSSNKTQLARLSKNAALSWCQQEIPTISASLPRGNCVDDTMRLKEQIVPISPVAGCSRVNFHRAERFQDKTPSADSGFLAQQNQKY